MKHFNVLCCLEEGLDDGSEAGVPILVNGIAAQWEGHQTFMWSQKQNKQKMERWEIFGKGITCLMPLLLLGPTSIHVEYLGEKEWDEKRWKLGYNQRLHRCFVHRTPKANSMHCIYGSRDSFLIIIKTQWNSTATVTIISGSKYSVTVFREMKMLCSRTFTYSDFYSFSQKLMALLLFMIFLQDFPRKGFPSHFPYRWFSAAAGL